MRDRLSKERRSWNMSRIRSKDTTTEKVVRSILHRMGYRFRLDGKKLPGRPDIVLPKYKPVVFVHGCFWHRHRGCKDCTTPAHRRTWCLNKLGSNASADRWYRRPLRKLCRRATILRDREAAAPPKPRRFRSLPADLLSLPSEWWDGSSMICHPLRLNQGPMLRVA